MPQSDRDIDRLTPSIQQIQMDMRLRPPTCQSASNRQIHTSPDPMHVEPTMEPTARQRQIEMDTRSRDVLPVSLDLSECAQGAGCLFRIPDVNFVCIRLLPAVTSNNLCG